MLTCEEFESMIDAYLDDDLTKDQREEFSKHISSCDKCKDALDFAKGVRDTLSALPAIEVPSDFTEKIHEQIKEEGKKQSRTITYLRRYGALAACLILAVAVALEPQITDFATENDDPLTNIPRVISSPVPAEISSGEVLASPETNEENEIQKREPSTAPLKSPEAEATTAPVAIVDENTEPETDPYGIAPANIDEEITTRAYEPEMSAITVYVNAENMEKAFELSSLFAVEENGVYTLDSASYELLIEAFNESGIEFSVSEEPTEDTVKFIISE